MKNQNINTNQDYKYGFTTDIESVKAPKGLSEKSIKFISKPLPKSIMISQSSGILLLLTSTVSSPS